MFAFTHNNFNVSNLERSLKFYKEALDLEELRRYEGSDFTQCWLGDHGASKHELELTWNWDEEDILDLGDKFHLAFKTDDMQAAHALHEKMGCIVFENKGRGIYFIEDPDKYWIEIVPDKENPNTVYWKPED